MDEADIDGMNWVSILATMMKKESYGGLRQWLKDGVL